MANKARYYGLASKQSIDARNTASPNFIMEDTLTRRMVDGAIVALSLQQPNFDNLSSREATKRIADYLKDGGFRGDLHVTSGAKITDGSNEYAITHANNDKGQIVVGQEKHDNLNEDKKKRK